MNVQQLKYIVALNRFRNFARAAEALSLKKKYDHTKHSLIA